MFPTHLRDSLHLLIVELHSHVQGSTKEKLLKEELMGEQEAINLVRENIDSFARVI